MQSFNDEIDRKIIIERNQSLTEAQRELELMCDAFMTVAKMLNLQGEQVDQIRAQTEQTVESLESGSENLSKAQEYQSFSWRTNISVVLGAGVIGSAGFLFGPIVGVSTTFVGAVSGVAAVSFLRR